MIVKNLFLLRNVILSDLIYFLRWWFTQIKSLLCLISITACFIASAASSHPPEGDREDASANVASESSAAGNEGDQTEAAYRELQFYTYLRERTGASLFNTSPSEVIRKKLWGNLLGYEGDEYQVATLTSVYRVFEAHVDVPDIQSGRDLDSSLVDSLDVWTITQSTYGTVPLRMFSCLFEVTKNGERPIVLHLEMSFVWENNQWRQLRHSVQEIPRSETGSKFPGGD